MLFGRQIKIPLDILFGSAEPEPFLCPSQYVNELRLKLENCYKQVRETVSREQLWLKKQYDERQAGLSFGHKDLVWLHNPVKKKDLVLGSYIALGKDRSL